jgi:hypothetical protein
MTWTKRFSWRLAIPSVLGLVLATTVAQPATADWLVLRDGSRVETKGPWRAKGRLLVFEKAGGGLSSIRADEVDEAASRAATEEALRPPPPPPVAPAAPPRPVLVLTDADIQKAFDPEGDGGQPGDTVALRISNWERLDTENGIEVTGVVRNESDAVAQNVTVRVIALDDQRNSLGTAGANVSVTEIAPGQTSAFRALLVGFKKVGGLRFETSGTRRVEPGAEGEQNTEPPTDYPPVE